MSPLIGGARWPAGRAAYGAAEDVPVSKLVPGVVVRRHTDTVATRDDGLSAVLDVAVPCCDRLARVERRVGEHREPVVACSFCSLVYDVELIDDNDGGFTANLTVTNQEFILTRRRTRSRPPATEW